jgi:hypothetical protein
LSDKNAHHGVAYNVFNAIAGGKPTGYAMTDKGPVNVKRDWQPGELARTILGNAFSLMSAGAGGALAAKQHRAYEQPQDQTIGGMQQQKQQQAQKQAQQQFQNQQEANEATLRAAQNAREEQKSAQAAIEHVQREKLTDIEIANGSQKNIEDAYRFGATMDNDFRIDMNTPGAKLAVDSKSGNVLAWPIDVDSNGNDKGLRAAQAYATAHPEVFHGTHDPNNPASMFLMSIRRNPATNQWNIIDLPPDIHNTVIEHDGQLLDKYGHPVFGPDGSPTPDPNSPYRNKDGSPTVASQPVSWAQHNEIQRRYEEQARNKATINDIEAQAKQRESIQRKNDAGDIAWNLYDSGQLDKMSKDQRALVASTKRVSLQAANQRYTSAVNEYEKASSTVLTDDDKQKLPEYKAMQEAKDQYDDALSEYNKLTGNSRGKQAGAKWLSQFGTKDLPDWAAMDKAIENSDLPTSDKEAAKAVVWNSLTPEQREGKPAAKPATPTAGATPAAAPATSTPAGVPVIVAGKQVGISYDGGKTMVASAPAAQ